MQMTIIIFNKLKAYLQHISNISVGIFFYGIVSVCGAISGQIDTSIQSGYSSGEFRERMKGHRRLNRIPPPLHSFPPPRYRPALTEGDRSGNKGNYKEVWRRTRGTEDDASEPRSWLFIARPRITTGLTITRSFVKYSGNTLPIAPIFDLPGTILESASARPTSLPENPLNSVGEQAAPLRL